MRPIRLARALLGAWLIAAACAAPAPAPAVPSRQPTGNPRYDGFFAELAALLDEVEQSEREEREVRAAVARRVGLPGDAPVDVLGSRLRERTSKLAHEGLTLELAFTGIEDAPDDASGAHGTRPAPSVTLDTPGRAPEARELRLLEVIGQAALSGATIYVEMGRIQGRSTPLIEEAGKLEGYVESSFPSAALRDKVRGELALAETLLPALNERARAVGNSADTLISVLDEAANTSSAAHRRKPRDTAGRAPEPSARSHESEARRSPAPTPAPAE